MRLRNIWNTRNTKIAQSSTRINTEKPISEKNIADLNEKILNFQTELEDSQTLLENLKESFYIKFNENISDYSFNDDKTIEDFKEK